MEAPRSRMNLMFLPRLYTESRSQNCKQTVHNGGPQQIFKSDISLLRPNEAGRKENFM